MHKQKKSRYIAYIARILKSIDIFEVISGQKNKVHDLCTFQARTEHNTISQSEASILKSDPNIHPNLYLWTRGTGDSRHFSPGPQVGTDCRDKIPLHLRLLFPLLLSISISSFFFFGINLVSSAQSSSWS